MLFLRRYFRILAEDHRLGTGRGLSGKVKLVLADPSYSVRRDQNDDYADYDVF